MIEDAGALSRLMDGWPEFSHEASEFKSAATLKNSLSRDSDLYRRLMNLLEQSDRQLIIRDALSALAGRSVLGIVADDRLEAICVWQIAAGTDRSRGDQDANFWQEGWTRALYVSDLTSAPWNVGWTERPGVRGAGTALVSALKDKSRTCHCDGIGLFGLGYNVGFYLHAGFRQKGGAGSLTFLMDTPGPAQEVRQGRELQR